MIKQLITGLSTRISIAPSDFDQPFEALYTNYKGIYTTKKTGESL